MTQDNVSVQELKNIQTRIEQVQRLRYRIYRSNHPIKSINGLKPIAEVLPLSGWNMEYYGNTSKPEHRAFRYVVEDGKEQVPPGTGLYVHNPQETGKAYYAITASINGMEDTSLTTANAIHDTH